MSKLQLVLRRPSKPLHDPVLYIEASDSLAAQGPEDFAVKFRRHIDQLANLKYLKNIEFFVPDEFSVEEKARSQMYAGVARRILFEIYSSLGSYGDSLLGLENTLKNREVLLTRPDFSLLRATRQFHACVVAAGPSLELAIHVLKNIQDRVLLICVDAVLKRLLDAGITPHAVTVIERDEYSPRFFRNIPEMPKTWLISYPLVMPEIFELYRGPQATALKAIGNSSWLQLKDRPMFWAGSSSAHLAYQAAVLWGAQSIALVGQDLCYHPETFQSHCDVRDFPEWSEAYNREARIQSEKAFVREGNRYAEVLTNPTWSMFATDYQIMIRESKVPTINTSRLGMKIEGAAFQELDDWVKRLSSDLNPLHLEGPVGNPFENDDRESLARQEAAARNAFGALTQEIENAIKSGDCERLYQRLPSEPYFLELGMEVVFRDWVEAENRLLEAAPQERFPIQQKFLDRCRDAIQRILLLLSPDARIPSAR